MTMTPDEETFLDTLDDLRDRVQRSTRYDLLRAAALLRQLLIDGQTLVDRVNRQHRIRLQFEIMDPTPLPFPRDRIHANWSDINPNLVPGLQPRTVTVDREGLLRTVMFMSGPDDFTVHDVVKTAANVKGGVHTGSPKGAAQEALLEVDDHVQMFGVEQSLHSLRGLIAVVLAGMEPLAQAIRA